MDHIQLVLKNISKVKLGRRQSTNILSEMIRSQENGDEGKSSPLEILVKDSHIVHWGTCSKASPPSGPLDQGATGLSWEGADPARAVEEVHSPAPGASTPCYQAPGPSGRALLSMRKIQRRAQNFENFQNLFLPCPGRRMLMAGRNTCSYECVFLHNCVREQLNEEQWLTVQRSAQDCFLSTAAAALSTSALHCWTERIFPVFFLERDKSVQRRCNE